MMPFWLSSYDEGSPEGRKMGSKDLAIHPIVPYVSFKDSLVAVAGAL